MSIEISHLTEPKLQFGEYFEHEDTKTGLAEFGPFGKNVKGLHPAEIKLGFIGTRETIEGAKEWIEECKGEIESENIKEIESAETAQDLSSSQLSLLSPNRTSEEAEEESNYRVYKILNRDFIGFSKSSRFESEFQTNQRWDRVLQPRNIEGVLKLPDKEERILRLVDLFEHEIRTLSENSPSPQVIILALTPEMLKNAHAVQLTGNFYLNRVIAHLKTFAKWVHKILPFPLDEPMAKIQSLTVGNSLEIDRALTAQERRKMLDAADLLLRIGGESKDRSRYRGEEGRPRWKGYRAYRNRAVIYALIETGMPGRLLLGWTSRTSTCGGRPLPCARRAPSFIDTKSARKDSMRSMIT
jgi:hypothetical protein